MIKPKLDNTKNGKRTPFGTLETIRRLKQCTATGKNIVDVKARAKAVLEYLPTIVGGLANHGGEEIFNVNTLQPFFETLLDTKGSFWSKKKNEEDYKVGYEKYREEVTKRAEGKDIMEVWQEEFKKPLLASRKELSKLMFELSIKALKDYPGEYDRILMGLLAERIAEDVEKFKEEKGREVEEG